MNPIEAALRRLLAAAESKDASPLGIVACRELHAAMNQAREALGIAQPETHQ